MEITKELINHVADVSRLKLTEEEIDRFVPQLKEILDSFKSLDEVDTSDVLASFQPVNIKNNVRCDDITESLSQQEALKLSKHTEDGYFKGPKAV